MKSLLLESFYNLEVCHAILETISLLHQNFVHVTPEKTGDSVQFEDTQTDLASSPEAVAPPHHPARQVPGVVTLDVALVVTWNPQLLTLLLVLDLLNLTKSFQSFQRNVNFRQFIHGEVNIIGHTAQLQQSLL